MNQRTSEIQPPATVLWRWYSDRENIQIRDEHKLCVFRFSLWENIPAFYWIQNLKSQVIQVTLLEALRNRPIVCSVEQILIVAAFLGKGTYNRALGALGDYRSRINLLMQKYPINGTRAEFGTYPMQGTQGQDIIVDYKDFEVEIKYWRNWVGGTGIQKIVWQEAYEKALYWLLDEIKIGKKNKRAMICGWFTLFEWRELLQLGSTTGGNPLVNSERIKLLPFLNCDDGRIGSLRTNYFAKHGEAKFGGCKVNWEIHGNKNDMLNVVLLY